ncbi:hypothetical protein NDI56_05125 [Haloarcula sp. S1CR25-12]|uniref:DUF8014 domain-containing protein n=1 Tax=Haloarcula saliterrae TaxID=2950534 RepID=A0ABU2F909_9EURY|nr:hypothetical protein [Haloarcula sp. S1CR25-12]MDS0258773.1 hypothetical protein [Haloarcula sp. S1CR25-12]
MTACEAPDCERTAAVELHIPWRENMLACPAHARGWAARDGVVPEPLDGADGER